MNPTQVLSAMGDMGLRYSRKEIYPAYYYISNMINDNRVIVIYKDLLPVAVITFSFCNNYEPFLQKGTWDYKPHEPNGLILYIEKMVSIGWNREIRKDFEYKISELYPNFEIAVWHRWAKWGDRKVIAKRRMNYV